MTEKLKTLMDRAAEVDFDAVDLAAIMDSGDRVARRRRLGLTGGVAALVLVAGGVAVALGGGGAKDRTPVVNESHSQASWIVGDTLHTPTATYDLGRPASVFVQTRVGWAFADHDGRVFSLVGGEVTQIGGGVAGQSPLVGDESGTRVGWVDRSGALPAYVVVDLATGAERRFTDHLDASMTGGEPPRLAWFFAIDGDTAYWIDLRGTVATNVESGSSVVVAGPEATSWVSDVTAGLRVRLVEDDRGGDLGSDVTDADGTVVVPVQRERFLGPVSPDGRWITVADGRPAVLEIATGEQVVLDAGDGGQDTVPYAWLDAGTVAVFREAADDNDRGELLTCEVPAGGCTVVARDLAMDDGVLLSNSMMTG